MQNIQYFFRSPAFSTQMTERKSREASERLGICIDQMQTEWRYVVETDAPLSDEQLTNLCWMLAETFKPENFGRASFMADMVMQTEVGPNLNFETAFSTTAVQICQRAGIPQVKRIERFTRYGVAVDFDNGQRDIFLEPLFDRMTEKVYDEPVQGFEAGAVNEGGWKVPIIAEGKAGLVEASKKYGWAMDEQDINIWFDLFVNYLQKDPTKAEAGQVGGCNSEHSRHWFWNGVHVIDSVPMERTLIEIAKEPWRRNGKNSVVAFDSNCSVIRGLRYVDVLMPARAGNLGPMVLKRVLLHPTNSAETHNHPSAIEPFQGAATGTGGLLRDQWAMYLGSLLIATGAGYCTDNLQIANYKRPWEDEWSHPSNLVSPLEGLIEMSNGASYYGNCYGVAIIYGFTREFGMELPEGRRGWYKPIMYAVGSGVVDDQHVEPREPEEGMLIIKIGGPSYRIGIGGGAASSLNAGDNEAELDFDSVQRAAPEMGNRDYRVIRACVELGAENPIILIHDQGAVGNANVLTELLAKLGNFKGGGIINLRSLPVGDTTLSDYDIWLNESQEGMGLIIKADDFDRFEEICKRENCPCAIVGQVTGDGWVILHDELTGEDVVKLPLEKILGKLPRKNYVSSTIPLKRDPLVIPADMTVTDALDLVLRLTSVGSKAFLTRKVDRSVTGLIAQQQCVGPHHVTVSDYAAVAHSHFETVGTALSIGEQPIKGLINPAAMARLAAAEALLQLSGIKITGVEDIKCSGNWMWPAKQPGEAARIFEAALALEEILIDIGAAEDGGKDSLTMSAKNAIAPDGTKHMVHAPGQLVIGNYVTVDDITRKVTPAMEADNCIYHIDLSGGKRRLGGSALAQCLKQIGNDCPDVEDTQLLIRAFEAVQELVSRKLVTGVHDVSDGGLITTILEMCFAGNVGVHANIDIGLDNSGAMKAFFAEEPGLVIAVPIDVTETAKAVLTNKDVFFREIGYSMTTPVAEICYNGTTVLCEDIPELREIWEDTSSRIDRLQANPKCVIEESSFIGWHQDNPPFKLTFEPKLLWSESETLQNYLASLTVRPKVAILREQGSNGDREMTAAFLLAGFEPWDITMTDLVEGRVSLDIFRGIAFVGGFSFADVLDAGKGWAAVIKFNQNVAAQFERFYQRPDTFSLGVCNGCQLMALLGWVPWQGTPDILQPRFIKNESERFESRFPTVQIFESPAIMLKGMAGSTLGVWTAHGEGRLHVPDNQMLDDIIGQDLAPIRFVDMRGEITTRYPLNPNGSPMGITALTSPDGRHLAMMPHPERTFQLWQWPWLPKDWRTLAKSPWMKIFENAYEWCVERP